MMGSRTISQRGWGTTSAELVTDLAELEAARQEMAGLQAELAVSKTNLALLAASSPGNRPPPEPSPSPAGSPSLLTSITEALTSSSATVNPRWPRSVDLMIASSG